MRTIKNLIYLALLLAGLLIGWSKWKILILAVLAESSYFPDFPFWPLWVPLGVALVGYSVFFFAGLVLRLRIGLGHHLLVIMLFCAALLARIFGLLTPVPEREWLGEDDAPPQILMAKAAGRLKMAIARRTDDAGNPCYPTAASEVEELLRRGGRLPPSGFRSHGIMAPVRVVVINEADRPVTAVRSGDRAGTLYYAINENASRYWITLVTLSKLPAGPPGILEGSDREPIVVEPRSEESPDEE